VQDEREPLGGLQALEDDEPGQADGVGQQGLLLGVVGVVQRVVADLVGGRWRRRNSPPGRTTVQSRSLARSRLSMACMSA
jgi:hypothetical protein